MPSSFLRCQNARLSWTDGNPEADAFGDVYYSRAGGLDETRFVFLDGTEINAALTKQDHVVIGETGFGTGLNFLAAWQRRDLVAPDTRLTFISVEGFPLTPEDLERAHAPFPDLAHHAQALRKSFPPPARGFHLREFDQGRVRLIIMQGDVLEMLPELDAKVDLWFLDGFAPAKNEGMWQDSVFEHIARCSAVGARLATFTAAGFVRRGLTAAGFDVQKAPGFGRKRERLLATYTAERPMPALDWQPFSQPATGRVAIIGGGFAGRFLAQALSALSVDHTLFASPKRDIASAVPAAVIAPRFNLGDDPSSDFMSASYAYTVQNPHIQAHLIAPVGVLIRPKDSADQDRQAAVANTLNWGSKWMTHAEDGLWLTNSGTVDAAALLDTLAEPEPAHITSLIGRGSAWWLKTSGDQDIGPFSDVVLATGPRLGELTEAANGLVTPRAGAVLSLDAEACPADWADHAESAKGYRSPVINGKHILGSSFADGFDASHGAADAVRAIQVRHGIDQTTARSGELWYGTRATTQDRLPLMGPLADPVAFREAAAPLAIDARRVPDHPLPVLQGLHCLSGLGSKGLHYAPLLAQCLAAALAGHPVALARSALLKLVPYRFLLRSVIRSQPVRPHAR